MDSPAKPRAAKYRDAADDLRQLAGRLHFDFGRRGQLLALADEFDRLADYVEGASPIPVGKPAE
jgi:hypothetical protein